MKVVEKYFSRRGLHNVKFMLVAKSATPGASIATLGQKQVPMKQFCDFFNKESPEVIKKKVDLESAPLITEDVLSKGRLYVKMRIYDDKTYELRINNPSTANLIKVLSKIESGSKLPGKETIGSISKSLLMQIAKFKMKEMNARDLDSAFKTVKGTAYSMGIEVVND